MRRSRDQQCALCNCENLTSLILSNAKKQNRRGVPQFHVLSELAQYVNNWSNIRLLYQAFLQEKTLAKERAKLHVSVVRVRARNHKLLTVSWPQSIHPQLQIPNSWSISVELHKTNPCVTVSSNSRFGLICLIFAVTSCKGLINFLVYHIWVLEHIQIKLGIPGLSKLHCYTPLKGHLTYSLKYTCIFKSSKQTGTWQTAFPLLL